MGTVSTGPRYFNFAANRAAWYDPAHWTVPVRQVLQSQVTPWTASAGTGNPWRYGPIGWVDAPNAYWIWDRDTRHNDAPLGEVFFRREFTVAAKTSLALFITADEGFQAYIDGQLVVAVVGKNEWTSLYRGDKDVDAGTHVLAVRASNDSGSAGLLAALFTVPDAKTTDPAVMLAYSGDTGWVCQGYPTSPPGWTPGLILSTLIDEAKARGVTSLLNVQYDFTETLDSAGQPWGQVLDWAFEVGSEIDVVIQKMETIAVEVRFDPVTLHLQAYNTQGIDRSVGAGAVLLRKGFNVTSATEDSEAALKNVYLLNFHDTQFTEVTDPFGTIGTVGRIEAYVQADSGLSEQSAQAMALKMLDVAKATTDSATVTITDRDKHTPWTDFGVGDWVLAPSSDGGMKPRRIMSIAFQMDQKTGVPVYQVELDTQSQNREEKLQQYLSRLPSVSEVGSLISGPGTSLTDPVLQPPPVIDSGGGGGSGGFPPPVDPPPPVNPVPGACIYPTNPHDPTDPFYDPRLDSNSSQYDPTMDPYSSQYDPSSPSNTCYLGYTPENPTDPPIPGPQPPPPTGYPPGPYPGGGGGGTGGGGTGGTGSDTLHYVQATDPGDYRLGVLWYDTSATDF